MPVELQATKEQLKESHRRCWWVGCKKSAWFQDWAGWNWCFEHIVMEIKQGESFASRWFRFKNTKIRNPYQLSESK